MLEVIRILSPDMDSGSVPDSPWRRSVLAECSGCCANRCVLLLDNCWQI